MHLLTAAAILVWLALGPGGLVATFVELGQPQRSPDIKLMFLLSGTITLLGLIGFWLLG